jgi:hypothetical protein
MMPSKNDAFVVETQNFASLRMRHQLHHGFHHHFYFFFPVSQLQLSRVHGWALPQIHPARQMGNVWVFHFNNRMPIDIFCHSNF